MALHPHQYFSDHSDLYAQARPRYPDRLFKYLAEQCQETECAWDCGTGSGQSAISLARYFSRVDATDVSREQIVNAVEHPQVRYAVEPAEKTAFPDASFDLITVAQALHWFDFAKLWPEVQRTLKPGGIFSAWAYTWFHVSERVDAVVERDLLEPIRRYWAPQNRLAWDGYRNVFFPFEELAVPEIQMNLAWNVDELVAYVRTWSATRRYIEANGQEFLEGFADRVKGAWGDLGVRKPVSMEFFMRVGRLGT